MPIAPESRSLEHLEILGVRVHTLERNAIRSIIHEYITRDEKRLVLNVNCHCLNLAYEAPWLRSFLNSADLVFCDGAGIQMGARILGRRPPQRIPFTDWDWDCPWHI